ncbi:hypothetical protein I6J71_02735 [Amycolatopsis sp. FDAARGOS 1241]|nr:hypothetical protein [Amycolatopsis sp. FDAARGOS 1241]QRP51371.1 hypothetical protein I6J71_02735 [Amycolatopsis sp. FDAARGOS 1241]
MLDVRGHRLHSRGQPARGDGAETARLQRQAEVHGLDRVPIGGGEIEHPALIEKHDLAAGFEHVPRAARGFAVLDGAPGLRGQRRPVDLPREVADAGEHGAVAQCREFCLTQHPPVGRWR